MGFIKDFFKIEERRMWKNVMSKLTTSQLGDMTKEEFLNPSTPEMKDKVELAKRCCNFVTSLPFYLEQGIYKNIATRWSHAFPLLEEWNGFPLEFREEKKISELQWLTLEPIDHLSIAREARDWTPTVDTAKLNDANAHYRDTIKKTLDEASKAMSDQAQHIGETHDVGNHSAHVFSGFQALGTLRELEEENRDTSKPRYGFDPKNQPYRDGNTYSGGHSQGHHR